MNKFLGAVKAGMSAADDAKKNRLEIKDILNSLAYAVEDATSGKVTVRLRSGSAAISEDGFKAFASFVLAQKLFDALILEERKPSNSRKIQIARFQQTASGYPCTLAVANDEYICHDRESLERVLSQMMQSTAIGLSIAELQSSPGMVAAQVGVSHPTGKQRERTVEGVVRLKAAVGKVKEEPFGSKVIRDVSSGAAHFKSTSSLHANATVISASPNSFGRTTVKKAAAKPAVKKAVAKAAGGGDTEQPAAKKVIAKPAAKKVTTAATAAKSVTQLDAKRVPPKKAAKKSMEKSTPSKSMVKTPRKPALKP